MTITRTHIPTIPSYDSPFEAIYPREGFVPDRNGNPQPVFLGHPDARCEVCERPFSNKRRHPDSRQYDGLIVICDGHLMRLTTGKHP